MSHVESHQGVGKPRAAGLSRLDVPVTPGEQGGWWPGRIPKWWWCGEVR